MLNINLLNKTVNHLQHLSFHWLVISSQLKPSAIFEPYLVDIKKFALIFCKYMKRDLF
ncbi:hypothetical protein COMA2_170128 [Candidatus Nitrospira nitrificans]|uniref:Uncharacterized protein n=1 Tax=Candidatus Nitrospira nitrificans TaxID=1742973 RepID=A0A0S4LAD8_9BACT|nr:hypothetical protein COMA2_170128 [Candidatus Nitrospira nitrificans]